jgi:hypothetical protein
VRHFSYASSMHPDDIFRGVTYQLWRLSDLKLLKTEYFSGGRTAMLRSARKSRVLDQMDRSLYKRWAVESSALPG